MAKFKPGCAPGPGRPSLGPGTRLVGIKMTKEQKQIIRQAAFKAGLTLSEFVRQSALYCATHSIHPN